MTDEYNTDWTGISNTYSKAKPNSFRKVKDVKAVLIHDGYFRGSKLKDCYFEVVQSKEPLSTFKGKQRVEVKVLWFGRKPKTTWAHITLVGKYELLPKYTGDVVANIEKLDT